MGFTVDNIPFVSACGSDRQHQWLVGWLVLLKLTAIILILVQRKR